MLLLTWGGEDMKRIIQDVRMHKMDDAYWMEATYFDLLKGVLRARGLSNDISVEGAMALFGLEPSGSAHRALDDAKMTAEIFRAVFSELDFARSQHYVDTFSNARERKTVKIAIKAMTAQKIVPTWELVAEHYFPAEDALADPGSWQSLRRISPPSLARNNPICPRSSGNLPRQSPGGCRCLLFQHRRLPAPQSGYSTK